MTTRRDAFKKLGGLAALAGLTKFLPACGDDTSSSDGPTPDSGPEVVGITTYVYLMMENRSYDHYLGARSLEGKPGDGITPALANPDLGGAPVNVYAANSSALCDLDPPHSWDAAHLQFNAGAMDGFLTEHQKRHPGDTAPMKYMTREQLPITWALADHYTTCDRWFSAVMGPTWPNRFYWHTGTSNGTKTNYVPDFEVTWPTVLHRLEAKGIDWAHYYANITVAGLLPEGQVTTDGRLHDFGNFINDALAGTLPQVSFIEPGYFLNDDHPPLHPGNGQELIETIYRALAMSPQWKNCLFVVVYDEGGGYYDHVAPPTVQDEFAAEGFDQLGSRIPALVVGPYVKQGYVSSTVYNHASGLKQLEVTFALDPLTQRVTTANDLTDCIDMDRLARGEWLPPAEIPAFTLEDWEMEPACFGSGDKYAPPPPGACAVHDWANANPHLVAATDRRGHEREYLEGIQRFLKMARAAKTPG